ncbi:hypothetical protein M569_01335, partial [Genlisea aurea]
MGCVFGKEIQSAAPSGGTSRGGKNKDPSVRREQALVGGGEDKYNNNEVVVVVAANSRTTRGEEVHNAGQRRADETAHRHRGERSKSRPNPRLSNPPNNIHGEQVAAGWPSWLSAVAGEAINGWIPRRTYSNVYKARDAITGNVVALKKVRFDNLEPESVRFMAREILILRKLDHPNIVKLQGLVTSRMSCSLYLVFDYMEHDLAGLASSPGIIKFTEPQVKCYIQQLLSGLEHCHNRHVLHRDIKGSNLLIDDGGVLKIADFGLASTFDPHNKQPMTSRVVTLWYRPPELLLGATDYGVGIDLWSAGCILAELFYGKPIMTGRTEVEQLHRIFKLCGSPSEEYWKKSKLPHATMFKPQQSYKRCIVETFKDFPASSLPLIDTLLAIDPLHRLTATDALNSEFFTTEPFACKPSSLPKYPPSKEIDAKRRDEEVRTRLRGGKAQGGDDGGKKAAARSHRRAIPAPEANAELAANIHRRRVMTHANGKSKSEKFPPPHEDAAGIGYPPPPPADVPFSSMNFSSSYGKDHHPIRNWSGPLGVAAPRRRHK